MLSEVAASWDGQRIAYSEHGVSLVQVYEVPSRTALTTFATVLQAGGFRLAISSDGRLVAAAAFGRRGVAVYSADTGEPLWHRKDITKIQRLNFGASGDTVWAVTDAGGARQMRSQSGEDVQHLRGVRWLIPSALEPICLAWGRRGYVLHAAEPVRVPGADAETSPVCGGFSTDLVAVGEVQGPMRFFDIAAGQEAYRFDPEPGWQWNDVSWISGTDRFVAVRYPYGHKGLKRRLELLVPRSGERIELVELSSARYAFCLRGSMALGSDGDLRRTEDGELVGHFGWDTIRDT